jgi:acyl carrier protein
MNFIDLFNALARHVRPAFNEYVPITSLDIGFPETGLDSMDGLMMMIHLEDIYGINEQVAKEFSFTTPAELFALVELHKTKTPTTLEEAMACVQ